MAIQITTHTPEQAVEWNRFVSTNPSRVVRILTAGPGHAKEGANQGDFYAALDAVVHTSRLSQGGISNKLWEGLVDAGVAEALCKNVLELKLATLYNALPDMPEATLQETKKEMKSAYIDPLDALCSASCNFEFPPTRTDKKVISTLKKNWTAIIQRLWDDPENTLVPGDGHLIERMAIAQTVIRMIVTDPSFLPIIYEPSDLTIPLIARHWKFATAEVDTRVTAGVLYSILDPSHPRHLAHSRAHPLPPYSQLLSKIYLGAGSSPTSSTAKQAKSVVAVFADHLTRISGPSAQIELDFFTEVIRHAENDATELEFGKAVLKSTPFWNSAFRLMKKQGKSGNLEGLSDNEKAHEQKYRLVIMAAVLGIATNMLQKASFEDPKECEPLVRIWANENLFGAIEETIDHLVEIPGITMQISRLTSIMSTMIPNASPSFIRLLGTQFPRWRIIGTILSRDVRRQQSEGPPPNILPTDSPSPDSNIWDHGAWQCFSALQADCFDLTKTCAKRGCGNDGAVHCTKCDAVTYCGETCQKKDWKEHQIVCGWMGVLTSSLAQRKEASLPTSESASTSQRQNSGSVFELD